MKNVLVIDDETETLSLKEYELDKEAAWRGHVEGCRHPYIEGTILTRCGRKYLVTKDGSQRRIDK